MPSVVFVAPFFLDTTLRFVDAVASLPGVRCGLVSQDPLGRLPEAIRSKLAAHRRIADGLDPQQIADATRELASELGGVDALLGALEQLQVPLGEVRDALRIPGMGAETARNFRDKARMKDVFQRHGIPCARHSKVESEADAKQFAAWIKQAAAIPGWDGGGTRYGGSEL
jgi:phosphoribosylaminoimidazole carboxylase (NCAIR synthetase)